MDSMKGVAGEPPSSYRQLDKLLWKYQSRQVCVKDSLVGWLSDYFQWENWRLGDLHFVQRLSVVVWEKVLTKLASRLTFRWENLNWDLKPQFILWFQPHLWVNGGGGIPPSPLILCRFPLWSLTPEKGSHHQTESSCWQMCVQFEKLLHLTTCTRGAFLVWQWCYGSGAQWMWQCSPNQGGNNTKGHLGQILETIGNRVPYLLIITWRQHNSCNESCQFWKAIIICHKGTLHSEVVIAPSGAQDTLTSSCPAVQLPKSKMSI